MACCPLLDHVHANTATQSLLLVHLSSIWPLAAPPAQTALAPLVRRYAACGPLRVEMERSASPKIEERSLARLAEVLWTAQDSAAMLDLYALFYGKAA